MQKLISRVFTVNNIFLFLIIGLGVLLRFYKITNTPPSLNWDEVSHGYNAYSILKTGRDEWGSLFPIIFRAYGDYKLPVYIYFTAVSEFFFGLTEFAIRLSSLLAGVGTVIFTYLLTLELFGTSKTRAISYKTAALVSALHVAVEPWSLFLSRGAFEANLALFLFVAGTALFLKAIRLRSTIYHLLSPTLFGLTVWTYNSYRVFTPIMMAVLFILYRKEIFGIFTKSKKLITYYLLLIALFFIPMFYQLLGSSGQARYGEVKILDLGTISKIEQARSVGGLRLLHNKVTYFLSDFGKNYASHFSAKFLFTNGGSNYQFSVPQKGILYPINAILILFGIFFLLKSSTISRKAKLLILSWTLLAPIPSSLTREAPHVLRAITMLPIPMILGSIGIGSLIGYLKLTKLRYWVIFGYLLVLSMSLFSYLKIYFGNYRTSYSWSWQYGYKEMSKFVNGEYKNFDKIIFTKRYGEPHEFLLFYMRINPDSFRNDKNLNRFYQTNWYWTDSFDKFYFVNDWQINENGKGEYVFNLESKKQITCPLGLEKCLLVTSPGNVPHGWTKVNEIKFLDGKPVFEIYENK